jgi:hypothetical protein
MISPRAHHESRSIFEGRYRDPHITNGRDRPFNWVTVKKVLTVTAAGRFHPVGPTMSVVAVTQHRDPPPSR